MTRPGPASRFPPVVSSGLRVLLVLVLIAFALVAVNSIYLVTVRVAGPQYQGYFFQWMFAGHLALGLLVTIPVLAFGLGHMRRARIRPNRRAVRVGYALFATILVVLASGFVLTRVDLLGLRLELNDAQARRLVYVVHVAAPLVMIWLYVLHRLVGPRLRWRWAAGAAAAAAVFALGMLWLHRQDPRRWNVAGAPESLQYFFPSLARTSTGEFIPERVLRNDAYCQSCHPDTHAAWQHSVHRFSSFSNPAYLFSVQETRRVMLARDGNVHGSRFCAGCHDPVPFFSGAFDHPRFDDPEADLAHDPLAGAGITCTVCHAITHVNSVKGNADYTIEEPIHYPFAFSDSPLLRWVNRQLVKANPAFHKATFLKPLHRTPQFCGTCHKVHLPEELNAYKWLRGQNHYDSFWLSGVSGQGVTSFYYPSKAEANCNRCHMPERESDDFGAVRDDEGKLVIHDHRFPAANTAIPHLLRDQLPDADAAIEAHREILEECARVDLFALLEGGRVDGRLLGPLRPDRPPVEPGGTYLLETVIRTLTLGHLLTQGTVDSNELWLDVIVRNGEHVIGRSGGRDAGGDVDPWSHFVNAFVIDREGRRIDRRNAQDIFIALYNNQIPPGAGDVVHYRFTVPEDAAGTLTVEAHLRYRKFDTTYVRMFTGDEDAVNELPIVTIASDSIELPIGDGAVTGDDSEIPLWQRWNDYGIGLLRRDELRGARRAFAEVEALGRFDGPLNLARVAIREGHVADEAPAALARARDAGARAWSLLWFGAEVARANGDYDTAIANLQDILRGRFPQDTSGTFDFSRDYRVLVALGDAQYQRGLQREGPQRRVAMNEAREAFEAALRYEPELLAAHWGLKQVYRDLGEDEREATHAALHAKYKPDDNARDKAVARARARYPAADHAAERVVIHDLQRPGAYDLPRRVAGDLP